MSIVTDSDCAECGATRGRGFVWLYGIARTLCPGCLRAALREWEVYEGTRPRCFDDLWPGPAGPAGAEWTTECYLDCGGGRWRWIWAAPPTCAPNGDDCVLDMLVAVRPMLCADGRTS